VSSRQEISAFTFLKLVSRYANVDFPLSKYRKYICVVFITRERVVMLKFVGSKVLKVEFL